ncbi:hypothetical protein [Streptomyces sp. NPDC001068]|uniref:hypothetical protein n=1 Tax=Streptomyces sp. NPDC001068 TaxID=3364544 RepID=UPI00369AFAA9
MTDVFDVSDTADEPPAPEPLWASFQDVVDQLTGPLAKSTVARVSEEADRVERALTKLRTSLDGTAEEQEDAVRALKRQQEALLRENQALRRRLESVGDGLTALLELHREAQATDTAAVVRELNRAEEEARSAGQARDTAAEERLTRLRASWGADMSALRDRQRASDRLARVTLALLSITLVLVAVGILLG